MQTPVVDHRLAINKKIDGTVKYERAKNRDIHPPYKPVVAGESAYIARVL